VQPDHSSMWRYLELERARIHYHYDYWCVEGNAYACCSNYVVDAAPDPVDPVLP
jgi:hypothetical protein